MSERADDIAAMTECLADGIVGHVPGNATNQELLGGAGWYIHASLHSFGER
jgi:hypothetical protein